MVFRRTNGEIAWSCDTCGDEGVISGRDDRDELGRAGADGEPSGARCVEARRCDSRARQLSVSPVSQ